MSMYQSQQGYGYQYDPKGPQSQYEVHNGYGEEAPPPPVDEMGVAGAGQGGSDDFDPGFDLPPPPESLLNTLVFDEPDSAKNVMNDPQTKAFKAGTFAKIIERLTHPTVVDGNFLYDFVLTYRSFATQLEVMEALVIRYDSAQESVKKAIGLRVMNVIKQWIERAWHDFEKDSILYEKCIGFLDRVINSNDACKSVAQGVRTNLEKKKSGETAEVTKAKLAPPPSMVGPKDGPYTLTMDLNSEEIARQLTLIEWSIWSKIQPWECLGLSWTKKDKQTRAPNVLELINRFNDVSGWVATVICTQEQPKKRTKMIGKFLEISEALLKMGNLNAVMEIVSGLNRGAVHRMKLSWDGLTSAQRKAFDEVKKLTDRSLSYANLRGALRKLNPPCIPYLGMYLTDLTFIEEGNKDELNGLINWNKRHLISETIRAIRQYQMQPYYLTPIQWMQEKLDSTDFKKSVLTEDQLYELSEWLEVRAGKERGPKPELLTLFQQKEERMAALANGVAARGSSAGVGSSRKTNDSLPETIPLEPGHNWPFYEPDTPQNLEFDPTTNTIKSGTLLKIIERLTHNHINPDSNSLFGFLAMYRSFCTSHEVLDLLMARWLVPPPKDKNSPDYIPVMQKPIQLRVFNFLKTWIDRHFGDFDSNPDLKTKLKGFATGPMMANEGFAKNISATITKQETLFGTGPSIDNAPPPFIPITPVVNSIHDINSQEFARQICLIHHRAFSAIRCEELLDQVFRSAIDKETKAKHVCLTVSHGACLMNYTIHELQVSESQSNIPMTLNKLLEITAQLLQLRNVLAARSIVRGIDEHARTNPQLLNFATPENKATHTEVKDQWMKLTTTNSLVSPMVVPLDPWMSDIPKAELAIGQPLPDKRINFEKRLLAVESLIRLTSMQKGQYCFAEVQSIISYFNQMKVVAPNAGSLPPPSASAMSAIQGNTGVRASIAPTGSTSGFQTSSSGSRSSGGSISGMPAEQFTFFMVDMVFHDDELRDEIRHQATETFKSNLKLIQDEIQALMNGTSQHQKLALTVLPPTAPMPIIIPTPTPTTPHPNFTASLGNPVASQYGHSSTSSQGTNSPGGGSPYSSYNPALVNPALANPALANPALANPALANPALANPALVGPPSHTPAAPPSYTPVGPPPPSHSPPGPPPSFNPPNPALVAPSSGHSLAAPSSPSLQHNHHQNPAMMNSASSPALNSPQLTTGPMSGSVSELNIHTGHPTTPGLVSSTSNSSIGSNGSTGNILPPPATNPLPPNLGGSQKFPLPRLPNNPLPLSSIPSSNSPVSPSSVSPSNPPPSNLPPAILPSVVPIVNPLMSATNTLLIPNTSLNSSNGASGVPPPANPTTTSPPGSASSTGEIDGAGAKKQLPLPALPKSRTSFTSASKQASIRDLMAGLGKVGSGRPGSGIVAGGSSPVLARTPSQTSVTIPDGALPSPTSSSNNIESPKSTPLSGTPPANPPPQLPPSNLPSSILPPSSLPLPPIIPPSNLPPSNLPPSNPPPSNPPPVSLPPAPTLIPPSISTPPMTTPTPPPSVQQSPPSDIMTRAQDVLTRDFPGSPPLIQWTTGDPSVPSAWMLQTARAHYVCAIKDSIVMDDIANTVKVGKLFKQQNPSVALACIVISCTIAPDAAETASKFKMKLYNL